jgi:hypothetical protein
VCHGFGVKGNNLLQNVLITVDVGFSYLLNESDMSNTNIMGVRFYGTKPVHPTTRSMRRTTPLKKATKKGIHQ